MKTRLPLLGIILSLAFAITAATQDQVLPAAQNAADPFTRDGNANPTGDENAPLNPYNVYGVVEYIEVPASDWLTYVAKHPVQHNVTELRAEVQRWIASGKAKPFEITCVPTKSGHRMVVENILEHRYPIEYIAANPRPVPKTFETRNTHFFFEWEPIGDPESKSIDFQCAATLVSHVGEIPVPMGVPVTPGRADFTQPRFVTVKHSLANSVAPNVPILFGISTPTDASGKRREDARLLCFYRAAALALPKGATPQKEAVLQYLDRGKRVSMPKAKWEELLKSAPNDPAAKAKVDEIREQFRRGQASLSNSSLSVEIQRLEVKLTDLNTWFAGKPLEAATAGLQAKAMEWIRERRGRVIDQQVGAMLSGNRSVWEDIHEIRYATEYEVDGEIPWIRVPHDVQPKNFADTIELLKLNQNAKRLAMLKDPAVSPSTFETRNAGFTFEFEPVIRQDGSILDVQLAMNDTKLAGQAVYYQREMINGKLETAIEQPIFATMKISTNISARLGQPALLGITTPMEDNMKPSPDRRILSFMTVRD